MIPILSVEQHDHLTERQSMRDRVETLQAAISQMPQVELPTSHTFHGGLYVRELFRPAGTLIVGKVHKKEHIYYVVCGTVVVTTDEGVREITGPTLVKSTPGTKRAVLAVTDALCMTIHRADTTDLDELEAELLEPDPLALFDSHNRVKDLALEN